MLDRSTWYAGAGAGGSVFTGGVRGDCNTAWPSGQAQGAGAIVPAELKQVSSTLH